MATTDGEEPKHTIDFTGNTGISQKSAARSGALQVKNQPIDPDLAAVVGAWPDLPETARQQVLGIVRKAVESHGAGEGDEP
jgi:hypothetical protein